MRNYDIVSVLISEDAIQKRLTALGEKLTLDYADRALTLICVLKGGAMFLCDLSKRIDLDVEWEFMDVSSYEGTESSGKLVINKDLESDISGKDVILVEDIIDTGRTISYLLDYLRSKKPRSLRVCALLDKPSGRLVEGLEPEYVGFIVPDKFLVGYGLDCDQKYRNLPYIAVLDA